MTSDNKDDVPQFLKNDYFSITNRLLTHPLEFTKRKNKLLRYLNTFLIRGGFPESMTEEDINLWQDYLKEDIVKRQIYHDIVKIFRIENPSLLENLLLYIGAHPSEIFSY